MPGNASLPWPRRPAAALWLLCAGLCAAGDGGIPPEEFRSRRAALRQAVPNTVIVLYGRTERETGIRTAFFQEANFYYLTGWREPGAILVLLPAGHKPEEVLFLPRRNPEAERWTGRKAAPGDPDIASRAGFATVLAAETFEMKLPGLLAAASKLATLTAEPYAERLKALAPARETVNAGTAIARLRMKKSEREIRLLERAAQITLEAHRAAWRRMVPGLFEYQVAAAMSNVYFDAGCERHAYAPIVGSGPNAAILHYSANSRRMDEGELLLMDVGAECSGYAADVTRTVPVSGRFTPRQREIYDMVLGAQNAVLAALKPGMTLGKDTPNSLHRVAVEYFDRFQDKDGNPMSRYFTHGLGHPVGLDVHDAHDPALPLAEGMVVTVEPGLYLPGEGIGVRIEDMVLVTASGAKLMSGGLPREADQIEAALAARK